MHTTLAIITTVAGLLLFFTSARERDRLPKGFRLVAPGVTALGVAALLLEHQGLWWNVASSALSVVAIVCIGGATLTMFRAGKKP